MPVFSPCLPESAAWLFTAEVWKAYTPERVNSVAVESPPRLRLLTQPDWDQLPCTLAALGLE